MKKTQQAFTLIELMTVLAIIGVLVALALPAYQKYTIRAQIAEGLGLTGPLTVAVTAYHNDHGVFPNDNTDAALEPALAYAGRYVEFITVAGNEVSIRYGNRANVTISGREVILTATRNDGSTSWNCSGDGVISKAYLPPSCR